MLITCGRFDELGPVCAKTLKDGIKGAEMQIFEDSAHVAHIEETDAYLARVGSFLRA